MSSNKDIKRVLHKLIRDNVFDGTNKLVDDPAHTIVRNSIPTSALLQAAPSWTSTYQFISPIHNQTGVLAYEYDFQ